MLIFLNFRVIPTKFGFCAFTLIGFESLFILPDNARRACKAATPAVEFYVVLRNIE